MLKKILLVLAVAVIGFLGYAATRPDSYRVERSTTVRAPADAVFATVADLKAFTEWSPWEKRDPNMKKTFSPNTSGVGASYAWQGNKDVGSGKMTITESTPPTRVAHKLEFIEPWASVADVAIDIAPAGAGEVKATWSMSGKNNFVGKVFSVFMDMDKMIGSDFEAGLAAMKKIAESKPVTPPAAPAAAAAPPATP